MLRAFLPIAGLFALLLGSGCVSDDPAAHFWRLSRKQGSVVLYAADGGAYLIAHGRVYVYEPPHRRHGPIDTDEYVASPPNGVWRELAVGELPLLEELPDTPAPE